MDINILVSCTNKKRLPVPRPLNLETVDRTTPDARLRNWIQRLEETDEVTTSASQLYMGNAWANTRSLPHVASENGISVQVWVCSAGYGLIRLAAPIKPYNATFGKGKQSISHATHPEEFQGDMRAWWKGLGKWPGPERGQPRTLESLARRSSNVPLMIAASKRYLKAIEHDLVRAVDQLVNPGLLTIISTGTERFESLSNHLMPVDGRLRTKVGGSMHELNVRLVRVLLKRSTPEAFVLPALRKRLSRWMREAEPLERYDRRPMEDKQVRSFIKKELVRCPDTRPTRLLRKLRDSGRACEQKRFKNLFEQVENSNGLW